MEKINYKQKLQAIEDKYYSGIKWEPKKGDYYTIIRNDLCLCYISEENETEFEIKQTMDGKEWFNAGTFSKHTFLKDFGINRVFVSPYIFKNFKEQ
jgi:hypothetical protein